MKIKRVESIQKTRVISLEPRPEIYVSYDGLAGLSQRPILKEFLGELDRGAVDYVGGGANQGAASTINRDRLIAELKKRGAGEIYVYFDDYVSYGAGAGEEVGEFFFKSMPLLYIPASKETGEKERLKLIHTPTTSEEIELSVA